MMRELCHFCAILLGVCGSYSVPRVHVEEDLHAGRLVSSTGRVGPPDLPITALYPYASGNFSAGERVVSSLSGEMVRTGVWRIAVNAPNGGFLTLRQRISSAAIMSIAVEPSHNLQAAYPHPLHRP